MKILNEDNFTVKYPRSWMRFSIALTVIAGGLCIASIVFRNETSHWLVYLLFFSLFIVSIRLALEFKRWKLVVEKDIITVHYWTGKTRAIKCDEITEIKSVEGGYKAYVDGKKIFSVSDWVNTNGLIQFIRRFDDKMVSTSTQKRFQSMSEKNETSYQVVCSVKLPASHAVIGFLIGPVAIAFIIFTNYQFGVEGIEDELFDFIIVNLIMVLSATYLLYFATRCLIWRINVGLTSFTIRNIVRRERTYLIADITKVLIRKGYINIYIDKKRVVKFTIQCRGMEEFLKILKHSLDEDSIVHEPLS